MAYLSEIIVGGVTYGFEDTVARNMKPVTDTVTLTAAGWTGSGPYTQTVTVDGGTANSLVSLQPTAAQIVALQEAGVTALMVDNNNGTFIATAVSAKPTASMTIQATITEVST